VVTITKAGMGKTKKDKRRTKEKKKGEEQSVQIKPAIIPPVHNIVNNDSPSSPKRQQKKESKNELIGKSSSAINIKQGATKPEQVVMKSRRKSSAGEFESDFKKESSNPNGRKSSGESDISTKMRKSDKSVPVKIYKDENVIEAMNKRKRRECTNYKI